MWWWPPIDAHIVSDALYQDETQDEGGMDFGSQTVGGRWMSHMDLYWRVPSNQSTAYGNGASFSCRVTGVLGYYQSPSLPDPWSLMGSTIMNVHDFQSPFSTMSIHFPCCFFWERPSPCWKWIIISLSKSQAASLWNQGRNPVVPMDPMDPMESMPCGARWWTPNPTSAVVLPVFGAALTSTQTIGRSVVYGDRTNHSSRYGMGKQWSGRFWYPTNWVSRMYFDFSTKR